MAEKHYIEQKNYSEAYLIPYLENNCPGMDRFRILEVGCAEGGFLSALSDRGIQGTGLELSEGRAALAKSADPRLDIHIGDITDPGQIRSIGGQFDLVVMRDVIEHIPDRRAAFTNIFRLLKPDGYLYASFPPRFSPFGGHHQNGRSVLKYVPYLQLQPDFLIRFLGKCFGEHPHMVDAAILNYKTGLSIRAFEKQCSAAGFRFIIKELFWVRPVYRVRFGIRPARIVGVPWLREFMTLGCECLLMKSGGPNPDGLN